MNCLLAENRILRAHLPARLRLTDPERRTLAEIAKRVGRRILKESLMGPSRTRFSAGTGGWSPHRPSTAAATTSRPTWSARAVMDERAKETTGLRVRMLNIMAPE